MTEREVRAFWREQTRIERERIRDSFDPDIFRVMAEGATIGLPREHQGRGHILLQGTLSALADPALTRSAGLGYRSGTDPGRMPNVVWPVSRAWTIACDMDSTVTSLGGSSALIDAVLEHPSLAATRVGDGEPLFP